MPDKATMRRRKQDQAEGKAPTTQAGEFIREEMEHIREGKHGARSTKQAIAIGLSKARRAGVKLPSPKKGQASEKTRQSAEKAYEAGQSGHPHKTSAKRSRGITQALKREGHEAASSSSLSKQAKTAVAHRTASERSESARRRPARGWLTKARPSVAGLPAKRPKPGPREVEDEKPATIEEPCRPDFAAWVANSGESGPGSRRRLKGHERRRPFYDERTRLS